MVPEFNTEFLRAILSVINSWKNEETELCLKTTAIFLPEMTILFSKNNQNIQTV